MEAEVYDRETHQRLLGKVWLQGGALGFDFTDSADQEEIEKVFAEAGEITYAVWNLGQGRALEWRAQPRTPRWFGAIVVMTLNDLGFRAFLTKIDEGY